MGPNRHPVTLETLAAYSAMGADQIVVPVFARTLEKLEQRLDALMATQGAA